jgi:hypothetical protein
MFHPVSWMKEKKPFPTKLLLLLCLICGAGLGVVHFTKKPDESLIEATTEAITSTAENVSKQLGLEELIAKLKESAPAATEPSASSSPDPEHAAATDALLGKMFLHRGDSYFTQSQWGAKPVPYELRDFELVGPKTLQLTEADRINGIDQRVSYGIKVRAYRVYDTGKGWSAWNLKNPPQLDGITLVRQEGLWKIVSDPSRLYALQ